MRFQHLVILAAGANAQAANTGADNTNTSPVVDLGYALHKATPTGSNYAFRNIRYAEPPLGKNRFQTTQPMKTVNRTINDGSFGFSCPQTRPDWSVNSGAIWASVLPPIVLKEFGAPVTESEDCLFLDVVVPKTVYDGQNEASSACKPHSGGMIIYNKNSL